MADQKSLLAAQERLTALAMQIADANDSDEIVRLSEEMQAEAQILVAQAAAFEAEMQAQTRVARGAFEVVLRPDQIARIHEKTGERMETVMVEDIGGSLNATMVITHPDSIEAYALRIATARAARGPAEAAARAELESSLAELEEQGEAMAEQVRILRNDPEFQKAMTFRKK